MQEMDFFTLEPVKEALMNLLYLWAKDNVEFGYRQGMNEVLAIIVYAFFQEVTSYDLVIHTSCNEDLHEVAKSEDSIVNFLFDIGHTFADIYWSFDRVMQLGIKHLYQVTKDMA